MLTGIAQGLQDYQSRQEDLSYQRQQRANALAAQQLANQSQEMQNTAAQNAITQDQNQAGYLTLAAQDQQQPAQQQAAQQPGSGSIAPPGSLDPGESVTGARQQQGAGQALNALSAPVNAPPMTAPTGGLPATQNGQPTGKPMTPLQRSVVQSESNGQAAATSAKGATGTMQTMPGTLSSPGYGVAPARDNSPAEQQRVGVDYLSAMQKRYGNDVDALTAYNWGPGNTDKWIANGRKPDQLPPATQNYVKTTLGRLQQAQQAQQTQQQTQQAVQQPSPADQIDAREKAGADTSVQQYNGAVSAQAKIISTYRAAAQNALSKGDVRSATALSAKADAMDEQQNDLKSKALTQQEKANDDVVKTLNGVQDQASYDAAINTIRQNPTMMAAFRGLNPTGDYAQDRNLVQSVAMRAETLSDQQKNQIAKQRLVLDQQKEDREAKKDEAPRIAAAQQQQAAQQQDAARRQAAAERGVPFAPSLAATAPAGTPAAVTEKAQAQINASNAKWDTAQATSAPANVSVRDIAARSYVAVSENPSLVGDLAVGPKGEIVKKGLWSGALSPEQQVLVKDGQIMVTEMQKAAPPGAQRSAATAAMAARYEQTKPNIVQSPEAFKTVAHDLYVAKAGQVAMDTFMDTWRSTNPDAPAESGLRAWRTYERDVGNPTQIYDAKTKTMIPNMSTIPTLEDGTPNASYIAPGEYFSHGRKPQAQGAK
jgi:hypothetical protein